MGTLKIDGRIKIAQFWPQGTSDADTTQIEVEVDNNAFSFAANDKTFRHTKVYYDAYVTGRGGRKDAIKFGKRDSVYKISVRLQGVDAPELHYKAPPLPGDAGVSSTKRAKYNEVNKDFCQPLAENAAYALGLYLQGKAGSGAEYIQASFVSKNIEEPADALDTYGRFVGNIIVDKTDINLWLAAQGWVVPTFYTSMEEDEIKAVLKAAEKGRSKKRVWGSKTIYDCKGFESKRLFRKPPCEYEDGSDDGKVLVPKLFRRTVNFNVEKAAKVFTKPFSDYMIAKGQSDTFYDLDEFFDQGIYSSTPYRISDFITKTVFQKKIDQIVFGEGPSTLKSKATNKKIKKF